MKPIRLITTLALCAIGAFAQTASGPAASNLRMSVKDINANGSPSQKIETYGIVERIEPPQAGRAALYVLKGDEGDTVEVQTNDALPVVGTRLKVLQGIVYAKTTGRDVFVQETLRVEDKPVEKVIVEEKKLSPLIIGLMVGGGVLLLALIVLVIVLLRKPKDSPPPIENVVINNNVKAGSAGDKTERIGDDEITIRRNDTTVRLTEVTREFLDGHFVVKSGSKSGAKIPLCGGKRITIGRQHSGSKGGASFIALEDTTNALSRNQALIVQSPDGQLLLENQRAPNPTTVDGRALAEGETITLKENMEIGFAPNYLLVFHRGRYFPTAS